MNVAQTTGTSSDRHLEAKLLPTDIGLLARLRNPDDFAARRDFVQLYQKLIYRAAIRAGLWEDEAEEVLQQTMICVARRMEGFRYEPERCSFKGWLMHIIRGHIKDCLRKQRTQAQRFESLEGAAAVAAEDFPDPQAERAFEAMWIEEWRTRVLSEANTRARSSVKAKHYDIYNLHRLHGHSVQEICRRLSVLPVTVRVVSCRVARRIRQEVQRLTGKHL
jgi:RNA polymerase sigma-70 factor (ECF subfamily)